jgi:pyruvate formate lyase activating enzyme
VLKVPFGYVAGLACDPVEKKPFNHVLPGSDALTFGMLGCDFHCAYCQNWVTSQALRDPSSQAPIRTLTPKQIVAAGRRAGASLVVSSYNEPLITAEWAGAVFQEARLQGLPCAIVSNGNATAEAIEFLRPWMAACKIDLKSFNDQNYRSLGGTLGHVTEGISLAHRAGLWLEIVTLLIPGFNDDEGELRAMAEFLVALSPDIPWHVTAFHPDYRMTDLPPTQARQLMRAAEIGAAAGLRFVYAGNLPGRVGDWEHTFCPGCRTPLIDRLGYLVRDYRLTPEGHCPKCGRAIPGVWPSTGGAGVRTGRSLEDARQRRPRPVAADC